MKMTNVPNAVRLRRLTVLANWLEGLTLQEGQFDLGAWHQVKDDCGTSACAVGWGLLCSELVNEGLRSIRDKEGHLMPYYGDGESIDLFHWDAVEHFYCNASIESPEYSGVCYVGHEGNEQKTELYQYLFSNGSYPNEEATQEMVVARIREVVAIAKQAGG